MASVTPVGIRNTVNQKGNETNKLRLSLLAICALLALAVPNLVYASGCGVVPTSQVSAIKYCIPVNVVNIVGSGTTSGFQLELTGLPSAVPNAMAGNILVYNGISGAVLNSWASNATAIWVNLGTSTIPASGSANGIYYLGIGAPNTNLYSATNGFGAYTCNSLSYDSGNLVFGVYDDFCGTSLKSFWSLGAEVASATVNNGLTFVVNSASNPAGSWTNSAYVDNGAGR